MSHPPGCYDDPVERIEAGAETWAVDVAFLASRWRCVWGESCRGIGAEADDEPFRGCCTLGAEFTDEADAANVAAAAACCEPDEWCHRDLAAATGIFRDRTRRATAVVDGACIFLNPRGFEGGAGCALHLAAARHGEPHHEWKPNVCWQLPLRVERGATEVVTLRRWSRRDFGTDGTDIAWLCTEDEGAFTADVTVFESLSGELRELVGDDVVDAIGDHMNRPLGDRPRHP